MKAQVEAHTRPGEYVFDPFSGRGTSLFVSLLMGRKSAATDSSPVAYCISAAKAEIPDLESVLDRIEKFEHLYECFEDQALERERERLPAFFRRAYYFTTLKQLLFLRILLNWRTDSVDRFVAALVLGSLHGEMDRSKSYFSNQMPRTISTKPQYSLNYWKEHNLWPRKKDVFQIARSRARFRLSGDLPSSRGEVALADARNAAEVFPHLQGNIRAVITSPPYFNVTNYEEDQWLRLWFLGFKPKPTYRQFSPDHRHVQETQYWRFLREAWKGIAPLLAEKATIVCRMGAKGLTRKEIRQGMTESIRAAFPKAEALQPPVVSKIKSRQTRAFRPGSKGCLFEMDFAFALSR